MSPRHIADACPGLQALLDDPPLLNRRPSPPSLRAGQNRYRAHACPLICQLMSKLSHAPQRSGRRPSPEGYVSRASTFRQSAHEKKPPRFPAAAVGAELSSAQIDHREEKQASVLGRPGGDLLSQVLGLSTIGAGEFNGRVRNGIGFRPPARTTRPAKDGRRKTDDGGRTPPFRLPRSKLPSHPSSVVRRLSSRLRASTRMGID
jgi:hypothetical protein